MVTLDKKGQNNATYYLVCLSGLGTVGHLSSLTETAHTSLVTDLFLSVLLRSLPSCLLPCLPSYLPSFLPFYVSSLCAFLSISLPLQIKFY